MRMLVVTVLLVLSFAENALERLLPLGAEPAGQGNGQPDGDFWLAAHTEATWGCK
jgi:hypothetical protein